MYIEIFTNKICNSITLIFVFVSYLLWQMFLIIKCVKIFFYPNIIPELIFISWDANLPNALYKTATSWKNLLDKRKFITVHVEGTNFPVAKFRHFVFNMLTYKPRQIVVTHNTKWAHDNILLFTYSLFIMWMNVYIFFFNWLDTLQELSFCDYFSFTGMNNVLAFFKYRFWRLKYCELNKGWLSPSFHHWLIIYV